MEISNLYLTKSKQMPVARKTTIRVLLVDDHRSFMDGMAMVINSQKPAMEVVATAATPEEAFDAVIEHKPDLVLMDMDLGVAHSLDFLPEFLEKTEAKVLMVTGLLDPQAHERAILKGARGVLLKGESARLIIKAIDKVNEGEIWASNFTLGKILGQLSQPNGGQQSQFNAEERKIGELTPREREIISALVAFDTSTNEEIADFLCISKSTLKNHLTTVFSKLDVKNRVQLMKYALNHKIAKPAQEV
jgi:DNA-binding NarL/FixJ family response regulator